MPYVQLGTLSFIVFILTCMILITQTQMCIFLFYRWMVHFYSHRNQKTHFIFIQSNFFIRPRHHIQLIKKKSIQPVTEFFIVLFISFFRISHLKIFQSLQFACIQHCSGPLSRGSF